MGNTLGISYTEEQALTALYRQTGGEGWTDATGWLTEADPCTWAGVTCEGDRVTELSLSGNGLTGTLPAELGLASYLTRLDLSGNRLKGSIPAEVGNLRSLVALDLSENQLAGTLPPRLRLLRVLRILDLHENALTGSLPASLQDLTALETLNLADNRFTGTVPPELGRLIHLVMLRLDGNDLQGPLPESLTALQALVTLAFDRTDLLEHPDRDFQAWLDGIPDLRRTGVLYAEPVAPANVGLAALAGVGTLSAALAAAWFVMLPLLGPLAGGLAALTGAAGAGFVGRKVYHLTKGRERPALTAVATPRLSGSDDDAVREALREEVRTLVRDAQRDLDPEAFARLKDVESLLLAVLGEMRHVRGGDRDAFIVRQTVRAYLPEALATYRALPGAYATEVPIQDGRTARDHLVHQLDLLDRALQEIAGRQDEDNARRLLINSRFLEGKFDDNKKLTD
jgi:hypothetical protein